LTRARALLSHGFIATLVYRYGRWTRRVQPRVLGLLLRIPYYPMAWLRDWFAGINISTNADIGPGLYIGHYGAIFLHGHMGANCSVGQCVTIGFKGASKSTNPPRLGNNVYVGTSAVIVGDITIGDDVIIGANTTVVKDVPARHRVVSAAVRIEKIEPGA
jgi:serine O-acetyltransferase